ncbi:TetR/AcrR family transcriptional regulator [Rhizobium sp. Root1203]|uniref:TetR/AcrR family transcriptional regulator n=1 Tax=Rhizobium sp. Root1203 TaxID=1736427 RepID=UPI0030828D1B
MMEISKTVRLRPRAEYVSRIIEAGTAACRHYGPSKTNVADIARLLGKSPASVYKIFPSKAALWDAIAGSFLETTLRVPPLAIGEGCDAASCLEEAALGQHRLMSEARDGDRQMFSLVVLAADGCWPSFMRHLKDLQADVGRLIRAGITSEEFAPVRVDVAAPCFCASVVSLWDPRLIGASSSAHRISAHALVSFAVAGLRKHPGCRNDLDEHIRLDEGPT